MSFGKTTPDRFTYNPNYTQDEGDETFEINRTTNVVDVQKIKIGNQIYAYREDTRQIYGYDSYMRSKNSSDQAIVLGVLGKDGKTISFPK